MPDDGEHAAQLLLLAALGRVADLGRRGGTHSPSHTRSISPGCSQQAMLSRSPGSSGNCGSAATAWSTASLALPRLLAALSDPHLVNIHARHQSVVVVLVIRLRPDTRACNTSFPTHSTPRSTARLLAGTRAGVHGRALLASLACTALPVSVALTPVGAGRCGCTLSRWGASAERMMLRSGWQVAGR